jgi:predicted RNA methylase
MNEAVRLLRQKRIDATRSAEERNRDGQFATPDPLAVEIVRLVLQLWPGGKAVEFLEPCVGTGSFFSAMKTVFSKVSRAVGIEKDPEFAAVAKELCGGHGRDVVLGDFTRQPTPGRPFNLIITNPPYIRHHHLSGADKARLRGIVAKKTGVTLSGLAGFYCSFMLYAHDWLADGGISVWLIPSEFLDVNYGTAVKEYLTTRVNLLRIHRFTPSDVQFADALVSSAVVVFEKGQPSAKPVVFSQGGKLTSPDSSLELPREALVPGKKWAKLFTRSAATHAHGGLTFGDLFAIKRGIATGKNEFFILPESRAKELGLPGEFLRPILPPARGLPDDIVTSRADGMPDIPTPLVLIDCPLQPQAVQRQYPKFWDYLSKGIEQNVHEGYLASRRNPWYSQEDRPPPPFLCTYMGRTKSDGGGPFRFIWNRSKATAHNVYLLLYPKSELKAALARKPSLAGKVFDSLRSLDTRKMIEGTRVYGGGLHKVEPNELASLPADFIVEAMRGSIRSGMPLFEAG